MPYFLGQSGKFKTEGSTLLFLINHCKTNNFLIHIFLKLRIHVFLKCVWFSLVYVLAKLLPGEKESDIHSNIFYSCIWQDTKSIISFCVYLLIKQKSFSRNFITDNLILIVYFLKSETKKSRILFTIILANISIKNKIINWCYKS